MIESGTKRPRRGQPRAIMEGTKMSNTTSPAAVAAAKAASIKIAPEAIDAVRGDLATNSVGQASIDFYRAALEAAGRKPEELTFDEIVEVTRRLYAPSADHRRAQADVRKAEREAAAAAAKAKREAERKARLAERKAALEAELAKLDS